MSTRRRNRESSRRQRDPAPGSNAISLGMASPSNPRAVPEERRVMPSLPTSSNIGALPLDAVYEILLCLPAKLLCRLRAVCRPWRALLSDPQFALAHAARHPEPLIALAVAPYAGNKGDGVIVDIMDLSGQIVKRVRRVQRNDRVISMELDLAFVKNVNNDSYKFLNLATGVAHHLPDGFAEEHVAFGVNRDSDSVFILGQLPNTGEYKVLKLIHHVSNNLSSQLAEVCTLNSSSHSGWRRMEKPVDQITSSTRLVIDGIVYLLRVDTVLSITFNARVTEKDMIITFDLNTEAWGPCIQGPSINFSIDPVEMLDNNGIPIIKQFSLANLNGSLCVVHGPAPYMDFWILTDFDKGVWVKQYSMQFEQYGCPVHPLLVLGDGRVLIHKIDNRFLQIYDPSTKNFINSVDWTHYSPISMYAGNLLSLDR